MAINIIIYRCTTTLAYDMLYSLLSWQWWAYVTMSPLAYHMMAAVFISWPGWWSHEQLLQQSWWFTPVALVMIYHKGSDRYMQQLMIGQVFYYYIIKNNLWHNDDNDWYLHWEPTCGVTIKVPVGDSSCDNNYSFTL